MGGGNGRGSPMYVLNTDSPTGSGSNPDYLILGAVRMKLHETYPWAPKLMPRKTLQNNFLEMVSKNVEKERQDIIEKKTDSPRIALWNIQSFHDVYGKKNINLQFDEIKLMNPDVLLLNEVMFLENPFPNPVGPLLEDVLPFTIGKEAYEEKQ